MRVDLPGYELVNTRERVERAPPPVEHVEVVGSRSIDVGKDTGEERARSESSINGVRSGCGGEGGASDRTLSTPGESRSQNPKINCAYKALRS